MTRLPDRDEDAVAVAFFQLYRSDVRARGQARPLVEYQARFVGFEAVIAREYALLAAPATVPVVERVEQEALDLAPWAELATATRYEVVGEIARGGMGVVVRARDRRLRRDLAMKVLRQHGGGARTPSARELSRFLDEALITGQLAHPGIVPVHDLGFDADGRAFFTMAMIEGRSLAEIIDSMHDDRSDWSLARVLGVVVRVCEAVAFAHDRGVIHRDLKPSNVMVGAFGETYVVDWGLARVLSVAEVADSSRHRIDFSSARRAEHTRAGDVVGTPAYMAPEQARSDLQQVGTRADVYAIGAILYHVLTGSVPYGEVGADGSAPSSQQVLDRVRRGPPTSITRRNAAIPAELVAICERSMQRDPTMRYASVAALADDLRAFLELRVVKAYETGPLAELRKWVRRNRALAAALAAAVVALMLGLAVSLRERAFAERQAMLAEADYTLARESIDQMLARVGEERLAAVPQMEDVRRDLLEQALALNRRLLARRRADPRAGADVAESLLRTMRIYGHLGQHTEARRAAEEAIGQCAALPGRAGQGALAEAYTGLGGALLAQGELDGAADAYGNGVRVVDGLLAAASDDAFLLRHKAVLLNNLGNLRTDRGQWAEAVPIRRDALALAERSLAARPGDAASRGTASETAMNLGLTLANVDDLVGAETVLASALRYAEPAETRAPRARLTRAMILNRLAWVQHRNQHRAEARQSLQDAADLLRTLVRDYPQTPDYRVELGSTLFNLANVLDADGDYVGEETALEESAREQAQALQLAPSHSTSAEYTVQARQALCSFLLDRGRHVDAAARLERFAATDTGAIPPADVARLYVRCAAVARRSASPEDAAARDLGERYAAAAVASLRAAVSRDPGVCAGDEFADLRGRQDYEALTRATKQQ